MKTALFILAPRHARRKEPGIYYLEVETPVGGKTRQLDFVFPDPSVYQESLRVTSSLLGGRNGLRSGEGEGSGMAGSFRVVWQGG